MVKSPPSRDNSAGYVAASGVAEASLFNADLPAPPSAVIPSRGGKSFPNSGSSSFDLDRDDVDPELDPNAGGDLDDDGAIGGGDGPRISPSDSESQAKYTVETLAIAVAAGSLAALFLGFVLGYCCGRKCRKNEEDNMPYPDTEYEYFEQRQNCHMRRIADDPKLLPSHQEEATYAEPILMPTTMSKTMTLTSNNVLSPQQQAQLNAGNANGNGHSVIYSTTSPKATLRKVVNNPSASGALFETCPSPCPSSNNGLYPPYHGESQHGSQSNGGGPTVAFSRDPYSSASFRGRSDLYGGSIRSQQTLPSQYAQPLEPMVPSFGTLRGPGGNKSNLTDNYGTARSVKKVYL